MSGELQISRSEEVRIDIKVLVEQVMNNELK
jgi:hypothetical protein